MVNRDEHPPTTAYEVIIPSDEPQQLLALTGLAKTFGWDISESSRPQESIDERDADQGYVEKSDLVNTSRELFGAPEYGETAHSILRDTAKSLGSTRIFELRGEILLDGGMVRDISERRMTIAIAPIEPEELTRIVTRKIEEEKPPCAFSVNTNPSESYYLAQLTPLDVTKPRLADHITARGFNQHALRGLLGRAIDVLNVVAEVAEPRSGDVDSSEQFIELSRLFSLAKEQGLSYDALQRLKSRVIVGIQRQLHHGQPDSEYGGELLIDGEYDALNWLGDNNDTTLIAVSSLLNLGKSIKPGSKSAVFLEQVPALI